MPSLRNIRTLIERDATVLAVARGAGGQQFLALTLAAETVDKGRLDDVVSRWNSTRIDGLALLPLEVSVADGLCVLTSARPSRGLADVDAQHWLRCGKALCIASVSLPGDGWPESDVFEEMVGTRADGVPALASPLLVTLANGSDADPKPGATFRSMHRLLVSSLDREQSRRSFRRAAALAASKSNSAAELLAALGVRSADARNPRGELPDALAAVDVFAKCGLDPECVAALDGMLHASRPDSVTAGPTGWFAAVVGGLVASLLGVASWQFWFRDDERSKEKRSDPMAQYFAQTLEWTGCGNGVKCATVKAPLNWDDPKAGSLELAAAKRSAANGNPLGTLVVVPGGPSSSGVDLLGGSLFSSGSLSVFTTKWDVVVWDNRGTGRSTHIGCGDEVTALRVADPAPDNELETRALRGAALAVSNECGREDEDLLSHVDTADSARDLELIRGLIGADQIDVLGVSYGTYVSMTFARQFPDRVRSLILDSAVDPRLTIPRLLADQAAAMEALLTSQFARCDVDATYCAAMEVYDRVEAALDTQPLELAGGGTVGPSDFLYAVLYSTYVERGFDQLLDALVLADRGDGASLKTLADAYLSGTNTVQYLAVACLDLDRPLGVDGWAEMEQDLVKISPHLGSLLANEMLPCATWPVPPRPAPPTGPLLQVPTLLVSGLGDPVTPPQMARAAAKLFAGPRVVFIHKAGHPAFTDDCAGRVMLDFLERPDAESGIDCSK